MRRVKISLVVVGAVATLAYLAGLPVTDIPIPGLPTWGYGWTMTTPLNKD